MVSIVSADPNQLEIFSRGYVEMINQMRQSAADLGVRLDQLRRAEAIGPGQDLPARVRFLPEVRPLNYEALAVASRCSKLAVFVRTTADAFREADDGSGDGAWKAEDRVIKDYIRENTDGWKEVYSPLEKTAGGGARILSAGEGDDYIRVLSREDGKIEVVLYGSSGEVRQREVFEDDGTPLVIRAGAGDDQVHVDVAVQSKVTVLGGSGNDFLLGGDAVYGGQGDDVILGYQGNSEDLHGGEGDGDLVDAGQEDNSSGGAADRETDGDASDRQLDPEVDRPRQPS